MVNDIRVGFAIINKSKTGYEDLMAFVTEFNDDNTAKARLFAPNFETGQTWDLVNADYVIDLADNRHDPYYWIMAYKVAQQQIDIGDVHHIFTGRG